MFAAETDAACVSSKTAAKCSVRRFNLMSDSFAKSADNPPVDLNSRLPLYCRTIVESSLRRPDESIHNRAASALNRPSVGIGPDGQARDVRLRGDVRAACGVMDCP